VVIAQDWVSARIRPKVVEYWKSGSPSEDEQGHVIIEGFAMLKETSSLPFRYFRVVMTKTGDILYEKSQVKTPWE